MKHNKVFFTLIIISIAIGAAGSFFRVEVRIVLAIIQFVVVILAVFTLTETYHKMVARFLWNRYCDRADWEYVDCTEYNVTPEVFGYSFFGCGVNSAGEKEICDIVCNCPDGTVVVIV